VVYALFITALNPWRAAADKEPAMHGTLPQPRRKTAARIKKAGIVAALAIAAVATIMGVYALADATPQGHQLLIRWGFEYPGDCG
jgi:hypothetical protein